VWGSTCILLSRSVALKRSLTTQSNAHSRTGCPIYTRNEVIGDTLVHCVGVPFVLWASVSMVQLAHARLGAVRAPPPRGAVQISLRACARSTHAYLYGLRDSTSGAIEWTSPCLFLVLARFV